MEEENSTHRVEGQKPNNHSFHYSSFIKSIEVDIRQNSKTKWYVEDGRTDKFINIGRLVLIPLYILVEDGLPLRS